MSEKPQPANPVTRMSQRARNGICEPKWREAQGCACDKFTRGASSLSTDKRSPGQIAAEAFYADNRHLSSVAYNCDTSSSWDRCAAAVLERCAPVITAEQHAALLRRTADQQRALDEARGNLAIVARMLADAVGGGAKRSEHPAPPKMERPGALWSAEGATKP